MISAGYRPGYLQLPTNEIALSISIPVIALASQIEPQSLTAWDARLLSESQYLTLIITDLHGVYPAVRHDGYLVPQLRDLGRKNLQFHVGLTPRYKPDQETLLDILRSTELKEMTEEDPQLAEDMRLAESLQREEYSQLGTSDAQNPGNNTPFPNIRNITVLDAPVPLEPLNDAIVSDLLDNAPHHNFHFSLSESLELLFQDMFLPIIQLRLRYGIGWAAAELLLDHAKQAQQAPDLMYFDLVYVSSFLFV